VAIHRLIPWISTTAVFEASRRARSYPPLRATVSRSIGVTGLTGFYYHSDGRRVTVIFTEAAPNWGNGRFRRKRLGSMINQARWTESDLERLKLIPLITSWIAKPHWRILPYVAIWLKTTVYLDAEIVGDFAPAFAAKRGAAGRS